MTPATGPPPGTAGGERRVRVWDAFVRFFHWSVAVAFFVAWSSEDERLTLHVWAGYAVGALVILRIAWGFVGPRHARFGDFVTGPRVALRYVRDLLAGRARRHLGHSPAGGVMILLLLAGLLATVWSGLELHAIENRAGPLAAATTPPSAGAAPARLEMRSILSAARADEEVREGRHEDGERDGEGFWEEVHELLADAVLVLVVLHVLGVLVASAAHRENLVASMLTGWKRSE